MTIRPNPNLSDTTRRDLLLAGVAAGACLALPWRSAVAAPAFEPVPLKFDPAKVPGLSERLLRSHWENNYGGAVKNLAKTREQLEAVGKDTPPFVMAGLMERELTFRNSVVLHELYFENLGGQGGPQGRIGQRLSSAFGTLARFEELLRLACSGLYGGSGWVTLLLDSRANELRLSWAGHHTQAMSGGVPLLVCDMYEHSYALDFGAGAAKYVDAFWQNVDWAVVDARLARADAMAGIR